MNIFRKMTKLILLSATLVLAGITSQAYAGTLFLSSMDWAIDPDGASGPDALEDINNFQYNGFTLVQFTSATEFVDYNYLYSEDTGTLGSIYALSTLTGTVNAATERATFNSGSELNFYSDQSTNSILTLELVTGQAYVSVNAVDETLTLGQMIFTYNITDVAEGYFFVDIGGNWIDAYYILNEVAGFEQYYNLYDSMLYTYTITTSSIPDGVTQEAQDVFASEYGVNILDHLRDAENDPFNNEVSYAEGSFVTTNTGSLDIRVVPEPGMLSLMGLAFLGFAGFQSRRKGQRNS